MIAKPALFEANFDGKNKNLNKLSSIYAVFWFSGSLDFLLHIFPMLPCVLCVLIQFSHPRLQENLFVGELSRSNSELLTDTHPPPTHPQKKKAQA